jgi:hypothetical protein
MVKSVDQLLGALVPSWRRYVTKALLELQKGQAMFSMCAHSLAVPQWSKAASWLF